MKTNKRFYILYAMSLVALTVSSIAMAADKNATYSKDKTSEKERAEALLGHRANPPLGYPPAQAAQANK